MKYTAAGTYHLTYTAEDECGNKTTVERTINAAAAKTILYDDGRFVINQRVSDIDPEAVIVAEYPGLDDNTPYVFGNAGERPWNNEVQQIYTVEFGSSVAPTSMAHWFAQCKNLYSINWNNLDTSKLTSLRAAFTNTGIESIELPEMPNLTTIRYMCNDCTSLQAVRLDKVNAQGITDTTDAFKGCAEVEQFDLTGLGGTVHNCERMFANTQGQNDMVVHTIYTTANLDFSQAIASSNMFRSCRFLSGAIPFNQNYIDKTYANLQGYFKVKA